MLSEFETAASWYVYLAQVGLSDAAHGSVVSAPPVRPQSSLDLETHSDESSKETDANADDVEKGKKLSKLGPSAFCGNILDNPDLVWTEDVWTKEKERDAIEKLSLQGDSLPAYWKVKYERQASMYWHEFYKRNADHFYKDRHYLHVVFPELLSNSDKPAQEANTYHLLEAGCGVGNAAIPLIDLNPNLHVIALDFAKSAIQILRQHPRCLSGRIEAHVNNIVVDALPVAPSSLDGVLCMFVLSAVGPEEHLQVFIKLFNALKPGGKLFFRDYARYDEAQLRFKKGSKLDENFYVRQDGTCSFFFDEEELRKLAQEVGFHCEELQTIQRQYANRQQRKARCRAWIHMKLCKPNE